MATSNLRMVVVCGALAGIAHSYAQPAPIGRMPLPVALAYLLDAYASGKLGATGGEGKDITTWLNRDPNNRATAQEMANRFYWDKGPSAKYGDWGKVRATTIVGMDRVWAALRAPRKPKMVKMERLPRHSVGFEDNVFGFQQSVVAESIFDEQILQRSPYSQPWDSSGLEPLATHAESRMLHNPILERLAHPRPASISLRYTGFTCLNRTSGGTADEPYFIISAYGITGPAQTERAPFPNGSYGGIYDHDVRSGPIREIFSGEPKDLTVLTVAYEHDHGDPEKFRREVHLAVELGRVGAKASGAETPDEAGALAEEIIIALLGSGDDQISRSWISLNVADIEALRTGVIFENQVRGHHLRWHAFTSHSGYGGRYRAMFMVEPAAPPPRWNTKLRIHAVQGGENDYYAKLFVQGQGIKTATRQNTSSFRPTDWEKNYEAYGDVIELRLELYDEDGFLRGPDDRVDICPASRKKHLDLNYDRRTGLITGDVSGKRGELIHVTGAGDGDRAKITFSVDFEDIPF